MGPDTLDTALGGSVSSGHGKETNAPKHQAGHPRRHRLAFKVSPARQRRIRREVMEFIEKYKDSLGLSNNRSRTAHKSGKCSARAGRAR